MPGVTRATDGSWSWIAPCGASGADHATSRDDTRTAYGTHRKSCLTCGGQPAGPVTTAAEAASGGVAVKSRVVKTTKKATPKAAQPPKEKKVRAAQLPLGEKLAEPAAKALFTKILREAKGDEHVAWVAIRKAFPRAHWGKVRDITRTLSGHKTFSAAVSAAKK